MKACYFGKKIVRNEFGGVVARYNPEVQVTFTEEEKELAFKRMDATGFDYDAFACGDLYDIHVPVRDRKRAIRNFAVNSMPHHFRHLFSPDAWERAAFTGKEPGWKALAA